MNRITQRAFNEKSMVYAGHGEWPMGLVQNRGRARHLQTHLRAWPRFILSQTKT